MIAVGFFCINPSIPTAGVVAYTFWDFTRAALQEEKLLSANLPGYADYMRRSARFFPRPGKSGTPPKEAGFGR
jgi:protein-S-isoprenylcysteine O-methyltransferase Ste14